MDGFAENIRRDCQTTDGSAVSTGRSELGLADQDHHAELRKILLRNLREFAWVTRSSFAPRFSQTYAEKKIEAVFEQCLCNRCGSKFVGRKEPHLVGNTNFG